MLCFRNLGEECGNTGTYCNQKFITKQKDLSITVPAGKAQAYKDHLKAVGYTTSPLGGNALVIIVKADVKVPDGCHCV